MSSLYPSSPVATTTGEGGGLAAASASSGGGGEGFESQGFVQQVHQQQQQQQRHLSAAAAAMQQQQQSSSSNMVQQQLSFPTNVNTTTPVQQQQQQPQPTNRLSTSMQTLPCTRCGYPNCDVQISACQCLLHARCAPVPIRACPNPRCFNSHPSFTSVGSMVGGGGGGGCQLELLPMEFGDLDEARRVADLAAKASWRAKEKSRSRKKAKLENVSAGGASSASGGGSASAGGGVSGSSNASTTNSTEDGQEEMNSSENVSESSGPTITPATSSELRTGRWTTEETAYCDLLIQKFILGRLPLSEGIKLNEFLSDMLKSKQSRLTKKMKNAKLSSKTFKRTSGYLADAAEAREFSEIEDAFFHSIQNGLERAEIKFHMQKEWREVFSTYCVSHGQPLNVDRWLASIEEMEKRVHHAKDAERMHRRKMMMGHALRQDLMNPDRGVVILNDNRILDTLHGFGAINGGSTTMTQNSSSKNIASQQMFGLSDAIMSSSATSATMRNDSTSMSQNLPTSSSPYLHKIMAFVQSHNVPFEYIDAWVPSFVPDSSDDQQSQSESSGGVGVGGIDGKQESGMGEKQSKCRLCFAGSIVANQEVVGDAMLGHSSRAIALSPDDHFNLSAFGEYSESFSFDVGCGLPGRVYHMGVPTWEQSVHNAPLHHFERVGGAQQWGIRTVVGIPVPSPNVGRVVVVLYSRHDRSKDHDLVIRLTEEFTRLMPSPRWKLVVDVGQPQVMTQPMIQADVTGHDAGDQFAIQQNQSSTMDLRQNYHAATASQAASPLCGDDPAKLISEVISIFGEHMPSDPTQPSFAFLQGFMSLRLLLLRSSRSDQEEDVVNTMLTSYSSYKAGGRTRQDIALMLARDFMFMNLQTQPQMQLGHAHDSQKQQFSASTLSTSQIQPQQIHQHQQSQHSFINPSNNNASNNMPSPHSPQRPFGGSVMKLDNTTYNPENMKVMHNQDQTHHMSIQQQHQHLSSQPHQDSYTQGSNQQQHDYSQIENCPDSMLNELFSLPQDLMAAMNATANAAAATTVTEGHGR